MSQPRTGSGLSTVRLILRRLAAGLGRDRVGPVVVVGEDRAGGVLNPHGDGTFPGGQGGRRKSASPHRWLGVSAGDVPDSGEFAVHKNAGLLASDALVVAAAQVNALVAGSDGEGELAMTAVTAAGVGDDGGIGGAGVGVAAGPVPGLAGDLVVVGAFAGGVADVESIGELGLGGWPPVVPGQHRGAGAGGVVVRPVLEGHHEAAPESDGVGE